MINNSFDHFIYVLNSVRVSEEESLYRGYCERDIPVSEPETYCDCLSGERAMCKGRMEIMSCAEIEKRKGLLDGRGGSMNYIYFT